MKGSDVFASNSLKADDLQGTEPVVTIDKVTTQEFNDDGRKALKPIIHFVGKEKTLVCNKTNWNSIVEITGEADSDNWHGKRIKLVRAMVDYQGRRVPAIRIDAPPRGASRPQPPPPPVDAPDEDSIPF